MQSRGQSLIRRILRGLRDAWLIAGITLVLFIGLELAYRGQSAVRAGLSRAPDSDPERRQPSVRAARGLADIDQSARYDPYRGNLPNPLASPHVNIDSAGRRITPGTALASQSARRVFMLGGSTMWGWAHPDSTTIPALVARRLQDAGLSDVGVVNLARSGFNVTQELIALVLELRNGNVPDVAVFLHGHNEVSTAWASGRPGTVTNQALAERAWQLGRRSAAQEVTGLARHSRLLERLRRALYGPGTELGRAQPSEEICDSIAGFYGNLARMLEALGNEFGFDVLLLWQPVLATTRKPLTEREAGLRAPEAYRRMLQRCTAAANDVMGDRTGRTYFSLESVFDESDGEMFIDNTGHLTTGGNAIVADRIAALIMPLLAAGVDVGRDR